MRAPSLRILTYHRVLDPGRADTRDPSTISATPDGFERQMRYVAKWYDVVSASDVLDAWRGRHALPRRPVLITFDDACRDFADVAWPILTRCALPATLFVPTAFPDQPQRHFWWHRLHGAFMSTRLAEVADPALGVLVMSTPEARRTGLRLVQRRLKAMPHGEAMDAVERLCRRLGEAHVPRNDVLTWRELRRLAAEGVTLGAHTRTHPALTRLSADQAREEIRGSRDDLERETGETPRMFAYPFGDCDEATARLVREEGFELAVTCRDGHNRPSADPFRLCRTNISGRTTPLILAFRLTGAGARVDRWRHRAAARARPREGHDEAASAADHRELKVAYIMSRFPKLSETFILNEMRAVERTGVALDLYPLLRERQNVTHPETAEWVDRARFHPFVSLPIVRANAHFLRRAPLRYLRTWGEALGGTLGSANFFLGALGIFPKAARFAFEIERDDVTHVHAHFATHPALAALIVHRLTGVPFSFAAHGSDLHVDRRMLETKLEAAAFAVTVSRFNREVMVATCGEGLRHRIHVIHCGVDPAEFAPPATRRGATPFHIISVASLEPVKGHRFLVDACRMLEDRGLDFRCDLVGDGPLRARIAAQIAGRGLGDRVRLLGAQPRPAVARLLAEAHVAVLASHPTPDGKREGIPVALMEAMSAGLPVVATAISGVPELVEPDVSGLLVPSGNPRALANALQRLAHDAALRERLGAEGRRTVTREFDLETNARELVALIASSGATGLCGEADRGAVAATAAVIARS